MERSKSIFNNAIAPSAYKKAVKTKHKYIKKYGDDTQSIYHLKATPNEILNPYIGVHNLMLSDTPSLPDLNKGVIVGNIRMGFGHYRISMAIASAANHLGYTPYWFDLNSFEATTGSKIIKHLNGLYSLGSRLSQKYGLFNKYYWEPLNSEGFKKLSYNAADQKVAELMTPIFQDIPKDMPYIATHAWPAQAAVHAGMTRVVNVIPDNWPMALHLAEGSIHTVQTPSSYLGYKTLKNMDGHNILNPIPDDQIYEVGHYIDHELVYNLEADTQSRLDRLIHQKPLRFLLTVGGAGAQKEIFVQIINKLLPLIEAKKVALYLNVGDHLNVWEDLVASIPALKSLATTYFNEWDKCCSFANKALTNEVTGVHAFYHDDIFAAVYSSNLLMRSSDVLITKPSELAFYPVPKLLIKRVGGHEAYGALRASEIGDGSIECESVALTLQMIDLMLDSNAILKMMNEKILNAHKIGIYNGAYRAVELAVLKH